MSFKSKSLKLATGLVLLAATTGLAFANGNHHRNYKDDDCAPPCNPCNPCNPCPPSVLMDGFYLGAGVGYNILTTHSNFDETTRIAVQGNPELAASGWDGGVFLGYGQYVNYMFYLGGEVFANYSNSSKTINITTPTGNFHANVRSNWNYGLAILPGIRLNCATLGYLRFGYDWANVDSSASVHINEPATDFSGSRSNTISGFVYGFGIETVVQDNWSVRADYTYTNYNSSSSSRNAIARVNPADNRVMVSLVYHFC